MMRDVCLIKTNNANDGMGEVTLTARKNDFAIHPVKSDRLYETFLRLLLYTWPGVHLRSWELWSAARNKLTC